MDADNEPGRARHSVRAVVVIIIILGGPPYQRFVAFIRVHPCLSVV